MHSIAFLCVGCAGALFCDTLPLAVVCACVCRPRHCAAEGDVDCARRHHYGRTAHAVCGGGSAVPSGGTLYNIFLCVFCSCVYWCVVDFIRAWEASLCQLFVVERRYVGGAKAWHRAWLSCARSPQSTCDQMKIIILLF